MCVTVRCCVIGDKMGQVSRRQLQDDSFQFIVIPTYIFYKPDELLDMVQGKDKERTNLVNFYPQLTVRLRALRKNLSFQKF